MKTQHSQAGTNDNVVLKIKKQNNKVEHNRRIRLLSCQNTRSDIIFETDSSYIQVMNYVSVSSFKSLLLQISAKQ